MYFNGRGDLGRSPTYSEFDLLVQHTFRLFGGQRVNLNVNIENLFDQKTETNYNVTPYRDSFNQSDAFSFAGFDVPTLVAQQMRAANRTMRDNPLYRLPSAFQGRRQIRIGVKYTF